MPVPKEVMEEPQKDLVGPCRGCGELFTMRNAQAVGGDNEYCCRSCRVSETTALVRRHIAQVYKPAKEGVGN